MQVILENVKKSFGREAVLDIPHFVLNSGDQCVITGGSGRGKTTLLNLISGIYLPDEGKVEIGGTEINRLSESRRDRFRAYNMGYIFQAFNLLPELTVSDNIRLATAFGRRENSTRIPELLEKIGLNGKAREHPGRLSMGQRQRVAVIRAIINDPGLVLADEPTGSLDQENKVRTMELIRDLCRSAKRSLILVTHDEFVAGQFEKRFNIDDFKGKPA
jgi:putative ABC transport system ATP-binding protein